ncbi:histidine--tRNA ligase [Streptomyces sp. NP160]|uniref:histidine--tRNA ligase n=1 Tax=Streptomyces sp. NP160 TaxID=2586637 RepID=UPI001117ED01|nr:histidine--tRNA ligase [Streptomyces sp. NP160]TNM64473.1 histidine--tRNA ligase [Streptomyces sp. NP160]
MARPTPLSGFPELLPQARLVEQHVLDVLREVFELHGFSSIETRAVEPLSVLLRKGEIDKEVYGVRRLADGADDTGERGSADDLALHFDLTVPFARYVTENAGHLQFPFRRYQVQKVWRGERPQEGRYREFTQADIDVVDRGSLAVHHDADMARVMGEALARLPLPGVTLQVNNRRLVEGFYRGLGLEGDVLTGSIGATMRAVDKLDKVGARGVADLLAQAGLTRAQADGALGLAQVRAGAGDLVGSVRALGVAHELLDQGLEELLAVLTAVDDLPADRVAVVADLSVARGLDYYTGTVYETRMRGWESLGSICSGGRYDALADDGRDVYPGVGISLGVTRAIIPLLGRGAVRASRPTPTAVVVAVADEAHRREADRVAAQLRARGVATEVSPTAARFGKQIRFADRRGVPFVWFPQEDGSHEVKDIRSGEQVAADPESWLPPAEDLRPTVVAGD